MGISNQEIEKLKASLIEIGQTQPSVLAEIWHDVSTKVITPDKPLDAETEQMIKDIFDEYEEVFNALA